MKMLVMSDTHGDSHVIEKVKGFYPEIDIVEIVNSPIHMRH